MEKEFVPYELALRMKDLGFDESCFAIWSGINELNFSVTDTTRLYSSEFRINGSQSCKSYVNDFNSRRVAAPLYQQAFRWFREKYDLWYCIKKYPTSENPNRCYYELTGNNINADKDESQNSYMSGWFDSYEETELECLKKLIEIVEEKLK
jgi:hypothetical protein